MTLVIVNFFSVSSSAMPIFAEAPTLAGAASMFMGFRQPLLSGDKGTAQTIQVMRNLIDEAVADEKFVRGAVNLVSSVQAYDDLGEARAVYRWVQQNIRFTKDPVTKEKLYPPQELLKIRAGDCDDISMLMAALMIALGYPARAITLAAGPGNAGADFSHVYVEAEVPPNSGNWVAMDAARVDAAFGVAPPYYSRKRAWSLIDDTYQDLSGMGRGNVVNARRLSGLSGYRQLGDDTTYLPIEAQALAEVPAIMEAAEGKSVTTTAMSPYGSYATGYTPGVNIPSAGYQLPASGVAVSSTGFPLPLLLLGGGLLLMMMLGGKKAV